MSAEIERLDRTGRLILQILQTEGRLPFSQVGQKVGLTGPAVAERVRRMEEQGLIRGYHAEVDQTQVGFPIRAFIRLRTSPERYTRLLAVLKGLPEILECHHVTGEDAFVIRVSAASMESLEQIIARLSPFGETSTAVVLSTPLQRELAWNEPH